MTMNVWLERMLRRSESEHNLLRMISATQESEWFNFASHYKDKTS